ncbi:MAG: hypothetical protein AVDCRST_MAG37-3371 [uncultured Rubrobacteraceae bacterium]|uniref:Uncharacterized protein n=1 Tax=uncultured Rubrobacteraceae bacterium TaxID=349277 RepID=A0A6J4QY38_9ACTN|nr:MAG: hypothetical protein AVDCRST_MAG37-3371 [uncultured Rubrobacteraceae bacterium]
MVGKTRRRVENRKLLSHSAVLGEGCEVLGHRRSSSRLLDEKALLVKG